MTSLNIIRRAIACLMISAAVTGCSKDDNNNSTGKPDWGPAITDNMLAIINKQQALGARPVETLTPAEARMQPTIADAVKALAAERGIAQPAPLVDTSGRDIPVTGGTVHVRIYKPKSGAGLFPVVMYYHGGGWVIADINVYDASARAIAEQTNAIVVSVGYRKGPEFRFPTAHNDSYEAYIWALRNAAIFSGDSTRMAVAGESAGGNLACNVSIMARNAGVRKPKFQVLVYPVASNFTSSDSYLRYAMAKPLNRPMIYWFLMNYLPNMSESADARINLVTANLQALPQTLIINAEIDPLRDDGLQLSMALKMAGVAVERRLYEGVTHEFFGTALINPEAKDAQAVVANALKQALQ